MSATLAAYKSATDRQGRPFTRRFERLLAIDRPTTGPGLDTMFSVYALGSRGQATVRLGQATLRQPHPHMGNSATGKICRASPPCQDADCLGGRRQATRKRARDVVDDDAPVDIHQC